MLHKSIAKTITAVFATLLVIQTFGFLFIYLAHEPAVAEIKFRPQVPLPGMAAEMIIENSSIGEYIKIIYDYAIGSIGLLSTFSMVFGGVIWITAAGNTSRVESAKATIAASLTGMILALSSYFLLNMLNPDLLSFKPLQIKPLDDIVQGCCKKDGKSYGSTELDCSGEFNKDRVPNEDKNDCIPKGDVKTYCYYCENEIPVRHCYCEYESLAKCEGRITSNKGGIQKELFYVNVKPDSANNPLCDQAYYTP